MSTSPVKNNPVIADEYGIKIGSANLGITLSLLNAGKKTDSDTGKTYTWDESIKITIPTVGDRIGSIKLTALQLAFVRDALSVPEIQEALKSRVEKEKSALLAQIQGF